MKSFFKGFIFGNLMVITALLTANIGVELFSLIPEPQITNEPFPIQAVIEYPEYSEVIATQSSLLRSDTKKNITKALSSHNFTLLQENMAEKVIINIENTSCCAQLEKIQAIEKLNDIIPLNQTKWRLEESSQEVLYLKKTKPEIFVGSIVAISNPNFILSFRLNLDNYIKSITVDSHGSFLQDFHASSSSVLKQ